MSAALAEIAPQSHLRAELAEGILAVWHKGREQILKIGRLLIEAKAKLPRGEFLSMLTDDFPFTPRQAQNFMELARDPRLGDAKHVSYLPASQRALTAIHDLTDSEFEAGLANGIIRPEVSEREVRDFQRLVCRPETPDTGAAWREVEHALHRPRAKYPAPSPPVAAGAQTVSELVYLLRERRKAVGLSQAALDDRIGWAEGLCSKYEIPHEDEGRKMSLDALCEACQALGVGIALVAL